jgi:hypothetical protein
MLGDSFANMVKHLPHFLVGVVVVGRCDCVGATAVQTSCCNIILFQKSCEIIVLFQKHSVVSRSLCCFRKSCKTFASRLLSLNEKLYGILHV